MSPFIPPNLAQLVDPRADQEALQKATDGFFGGSIWLLILLPVVFAIIMAALKRRQTPELPHVEEGDWEEEVVNSPLPVILHVYRPWCIGDRVIEAQVVKLAEARQGRLKVRWLDIEKNSGLVASFPSLTERCVALFVRGELLWERQGIHEFNDLLREIESALDRDEKTKAGASEGAASL